MNNFFEESLGSEFCKNKSTNKLSQTKEELIMKTADHVNKPHDDDIKWIKDFISDAKPVSKSFLEILDKKLYKPLLEYLPHHFPVPLPVLPSKIDYSEFLNLVHNQNGGGGCFLMAAMAIQDIMKKIECPFTPDASYHFAEYVYNLSKVNGDPSGLNRPADSRFPQVDEKYDDAFQRSRYGCCSEASFPSNYDPPHHLDTPSPEAIEEALEYKMQFNSDQILKGDNLTVERVKDLLAWKGPVSLVNYYPDHVVAIIGYDDNQIAVDGKYGAFLLQNSYGDQWGDNGKVWISYESFTARIPGEEVGFYTNVTTPRPLKHQYTGRVRIRTDSGRKFISVAVGVEGKNPSFVWNMPCQMQMIDDSKNLMLDFPLPDYAKDFWPPNEKNHWYVEVCDASPTSSQYSTGYISDVALVERLFDGQGNCTPVLYRSGYYRFYFNGRQSVKVFIPTRENYKISLKSDKKNYQINEKITLSGRLIHLFNFSDNFKLERPEPYQNVNLCVVPGEHFVPDNIIRKGKTDQDGNYSFVVPAKAIATIKYRAKAVKDDKSIMANSSVCLIKIVSN